MTRPKLVGITGGIGAGKSVITKIFELMGIPIYDADSRAKSLMIESEGLRSAIVVLFGDESFINGKLNRTHIARKAFNEPKLLSQLNSLIHPAVDEDFQEWIKANADQPYLVKEAALLFETGSYKKLDTTILVTAPISLRIKRVLGRDLHRNKRDVESIMEKQMADEQKAPLADIILRNDESELLIPQIIKLYQEFSKG